MTTRKQQESFILGFLAAGIASFVIVLLASLLPVFDSSASNPPTATEAAPATPTATSEDNATSGGQGTSQGNGQGNGGRGNGGPPEGRGPGSGNGSEAIGDPMSYGTADQDVLDAFAAGSCVICHSIKGVGGGEATVGPHLFRTGAIAADRRPGPSVEAYIKESITDPDAFIMPNCPNGPCPSGVMPQSLAETLSTQQIETIVNYLAVLGTADEPSVLNP